MLFSALCFCSHVISIASHHIWFHLVGTLSPASINGRSGLPCCSETSTQFPPSIEVWICTFLSFDEDHCMCSCCPHFICVFTSHGRWRTWVTLYHLPFGHTMVIRRLVLYPSAQKWQSRIMLFIDCDGSKFKDSQSVHSLLYVKSEHFIFVNLNILCPSSMNRGIG